MKRLFIFFLILLFFMLAGVWIISDPGYLLISRRSIAIEMPLWLAIIGFIISVIIIYVLIRIFRYFIVLPKRWHIWRRSRRQQKQQIMEDQRLLAMLCQEPRNSNLILKTLPTLIKKRGWSRVQIQALERRCYEDVIKEAIIHMDRARFEACWKQLPRQLKKDTGFLCLYMHGLIHYCQTERAEYLTRALLNRQWFGPLIRIYGLIKISHPERQLANAENWHKYHPNDPDLLLTLGRLCKQLQLWGKAKDYLMTSLLHCPRAIEVYRELGELFEALGDLKQALKFYKKATEIDQGMES